MRSVGFFGVRLGSLQRKQKKKKSKKQTCANLVSCFCQTVHCLCFHLFFVCCHSHVPNLLPHASQAFPYGAWRLLNSSQAEFNWQLLAAMHQTTVSQLPVVRGKQVSPSSASERSLVLRASSHTPGPHTHTHTPLILSNFTS